MKRTLHRVGSAVATLLIGTFLFSTVIVELFGSDEAIVRVKQLVVMPGLPILIAAIGATGASGFALSRGRGGRLVSAKRKRMPFIAANGLLVLVPCALLLDVWASSGAFDGRFNFVQAVEIIAGTVNLALMAMNARDGMRLSGRLRSRVATGAPGDRDLLVADGLRTSGPDENREKGR